MRFQVAAVLPADINDLTWTQALYVGLQRLQREGRVAFQYTENVPTAEAERVLRRYAERRPDLIIAHSTAYKDAVFKVASEFRDLKFAYPPSGSSDRDVNLAAYDQAFWEAGYLMGAVAAHVTKTGVIGFVGPIPVPTCRAIYNAVREAVRSIKPSVETLPPVYVGNFVDIARAKALALSIMDRRADVVTTCGSGPSRGSIEAARERGGWATGHAFDMAPLSPKHVLGSTYWDSYRGIGQILTDMERGTFAPARHYPGTAGEGITTFKLNEEVTKTIPPTAVRALKALLAQLERGTLKITPNFD